MMILDRIEVLTDANEESPPKEITMPYFNSNRLDKTPPMTLHNISQKIAEESSKTILIYGFNGVGKTRLSRSYKETLHSSSEKAGSVLYYNAFTEDLFYWDNDLANNSKRRLKIHPNNFTYWILEEQGLENQVIELFQSYTSKRLTPKFNNDYSEVSFSIATGDKTIDDVKISKGEESCFIWCIFYVLIQQIIEDDENSIKHIFIDDPVTSLDEEHLIELAVDIANTIKDVESIKFIITTHNPLFYNILCNHLSNHLKYKKNKKPKKFFLNKTEDGFYSFKELNDTPLSYHLHILREINRAIETNTVEKYHFNLLRNLIEKLSIFLGYPKWGELLDIKDRSIHTRMINLLSHSNVPHEEVQMTSNERTEKLRTIIKYIENTYKFYQSTNKGDSLR